MSGILSQYRNLLAICIAMAGLLLAGGAALAAVPAAVAGGVAPLIVSCTTPSFGAATGYATGTSPWSVAVGDFNRDGNPDLAVVNYGLNTVSVRLGSSSGSFGAATSYAVQAGPMSVAIGDFNRDGSPDLA